MAVMLSVLVITLSVMVVSVSVLTVMLSVLTMTDFTSHFFIVFPVRLYIVCIRFLRGFTSPLSFSCFSSQMQSYDISPYPWYDRVDFFVVRPRAGNESVFILP